MGQFRYLPNVVTLTLNEQQCNGCRMCVAVCPHGVFAIVDRVAQIIDRDACMECGACARNCASGAINVESGTGCAAAMIIAALKRTGPSCCGGG
jgi:ferredoxin